MMNARDDVLCLAFLGMTACTATPQTATTAMPSADTSPLPVLVRQAVRAEVSLQALFLGRLQLDADGCLRGGGEAGPFIIWHHDTRIDRAADGRVQIVDTTTGNSVKVGDEIALSGGNISEVRAADLTAPVPETCRTGGGYFLAGSVMSEAQRLGITERQRNRPRVPSPPEAKKPTV